MAECFSFRFCCRWVMAFCERWWTNTKEGICRKLGKGGVRDGWMDGWMELLEREVLLCVNEVWWSHLESNCCFWLFGLSFVVFISISYLVKDRILHGSGRRCSF